MGAQDEALGGLTVRPPSPPIITRPHSAGAVQNKPLASQHLPSSHEHSLAGLEPNPASFNTFTSLEAVSAATSFKLQSSSERRSSSARKKGVGLGRGKATQQDRPRRSKPVKADLAVSLPPRPGPRPRLAHVEVYTLYSQPLLLQIDVSFWEAEISPLLSELGAGVCAPASVPTDQLCRVCDCLWAGLQRRGLPGRAGARAKERRSALLRAVFRLLDHSDPRLLLKLAKIILAVRTVREEGWSKTTNPCTPHPLPPHPLTPSPPHTALSVGGDRKEPAQYL